ncbi:MAG TPA: flagellar biosynthesis protein FliQ [candidate division Zixibacteria bacterium]|nr:MAG: flagellar export apparatus protein FliQ [bacterium]HDL01250.1 flagellar biosynthesis protein FliQ [candidate division Zixibacteria bacterium]
MDIATVSGIMSEATRIALYISAPILMAGLIAGLVVSIFQATTQIQELTLSFIPKIIAVIIVLIILGPWMLNQIVTYTIKLYQSIPGLIG